MELQAAACRWLRAVSSWQNTRGAMPTLRPIVYAPGRLQLLDQRLLPAEEVYLDVHTCEDAHRLIREMAVRGAPAIAVAGFLALAVQLRNEGAGAQFASATDAADKIRGMLDYLVSRCGRGLRVPDSSCTIPRACWHQPLACARRDLGVRRAVAPRR